MNKNEKDMEQEDLQFLVVDPSQAEDLANGDWREFAPGVRVCVRPFSRKKAREINKKAREITRKKFPKLKGPFLLEKVEEEADRLTKEHIIAGWEGVKRKVDGGKIEEVPCDREGIAFMDRYYPSFINWIVGESDDVSETAITFQTEKLGNSKGTPAGKQSSGSTK